MILELGRTPSGGKAVLSNPPNPHAFISGQSGSGKSFFLKRLTAQAVQQGALVLVFDYTGDFTTFDSLNGLSIQKVNVASPNFSVNPLLGNAGQSTDIRAQQLLNLMRSVFRFGSRAATALHRCARMYLMETQHPNLQGLLNYAQSQQDVGRGLDAALEPLDLFASLIHGGEVPLSLNLCNPGLVVLDFAQVQAQDLRKFLVELLLRSIWDQRTATQPLPDFPLILVLDECQGLSWGQDSMSIRILREGRKFGIAGWFSSQWISNKEASSALSQAALQAHFRPDDQNMDKLAKSFCQLKVDLPKYQDLTRSLRVGQFLWRRLDGKCVLVHVDG